MSRHNEEVRCLLVLMACCLAIAANACGGDSKDSSEEGPNAQELVQRAASATKALKSFHFRLSHENGGTPMLLGLELTRAEGDVAVPDRLAADIRAKAASVNVSVKVVGIEQKTWITNPFSRRWQLVPGASVKDVADPVALVNAVLGSLTGVRSDKVGELDGTKTYRLSGQIDASALKDALSSAQPGYTANVEAWIGEKDSLPRRVRLNGQLSKDEPKDIVRQIDISRFDVAVDIKPPE